MELRDIFELTGDEFDFAEACWEIEHASGDVVELNARAYFALAKNAGYTDAGAVAAPLMACGPRGGIKIKVRP